MARTIADLHPDDAAARETLRTQLRAVRETAGLSQRQLGERLGTDQANIRRLEQQGVRQSRTGTVARWARALGHELVLEPVDLPSPSLFRRPSRASGVDEILTAILHGPELTGPEWKAAHVMAQLIGIRNAAGVTQHALAARLGLTYQAIAFTEQATADTALVVLQRYARGIAQCSRYRTGRLDVRLEPIARNPQHPGDSRSVDTGELIQSA